MSESLMDTDSHSSPPTQAESASPDRSTNSLPKPDNAAGDFAGPRSALAKVFVGPEGLYAGGRWLIYIVLGLITLFALNPVVDALRLKLSNFLWRAMAVEVRMMLAAVLPGLVMARLEGRPFGNFGLPAKGAFGKNFWAGAIWGLSALTVLMLALGALGAFSFGTFHLHGDRALKLGCFYATFFVITAFFEDFLMRGYSQWVLTRCMNFWPAATLLSIIFGAIHGINPGEDKVGLVAVTAIGLFFCLTLRRTGTLWWAVGFHMAWDWGESFLYSVPDSGGVLPGHLLNSSIHGPVWLTGGSVGPEGSYLVFVLIAVLCVLFSRAYPDVKYGIEDR
jgi:uncharacterized protein